MEEAFKKAYQLHDLLFQSEEYIQLKKIEKEMVEDKDLQPLFLSYQKAQEEYVQDKSQKNLIQLHEIKLKIDCHPKVIAYQKSFKQYQILLNQITDVVFDGFIEQEDLLKKIRTM